MNIKISYLIFLLLLPLNGLANGIELNDVSQLNATEVKRVIHVTQKEQLINAVNNAKENHMTLSISGAKHSQGGQTLYPQSIHLDMLGYNKILNLNLEKKTITVQSGVTWADIQRVINPHNLAIKVMQSSNIFTVGGSMSVNAHGRDPNYGPIITTVKSFHLLLPNGKIINVSRHQNPMLFKLAIGGYGLFGIITDATLSLTANNISTDHYYETNIFKFDELRKKILKNNKVSIFFGRLSIAPNKLFLKQMYVGSCFNSGLIQTPAPKLVDTDKTDFIVEPLFNLSRDYGWGKKIFWALVKYYYSWSSSKGTKRLSRNNAMRPPIKFLTNYHSKKRSDILQEYFIPTNNFIQFINSFRIIAKKNHINLLSVTIRYEPANRSAFLSYTKQDSYAVVIYLNIQLSDKGKEEAKEWTRELVNAALNQRGTYYLPYQLWPTEDQLIKAYPEFEQFCKLKKKYDPNEIFMNQFYSRYCCNTFVKCRT